MKFKIAKGGAIIQQLSLFDETPDQPHDARATRAAYNDEQLESFGQTPHPDDPTAPTSTVAAAVAYEAMIEALRDNIDPLMVEVQTDTGLYLRIIQCTIRTIVDGQTMSIFELLKQARMDRQDEILAQREEIENLETDDWSM